MSASRLWKAMLAFAVLGALTGCDAFQVPHSTPGPESGLIVENSGYGAQRGAEGSGVKRISQAGPVVSRSGSSTEVLSTGFTGVISSPGPNRQGR